MFKVVHTRHTGDMSTITTQLQGSCKRKSTNFTAYAISKFNKKPELNLNLFHTLGIGLHQLAYWKFPLQSMLIGWVH